MLIGLTQFDAADDATVILLFPVAINASLLWAFGRTLRQGPTMIERFAVRIEGGEIGPARRAHCRQATAAWCLVFVFNGVVSGVLAVGASVELWTIYTGAVAYGVMGAMFLGEYALRRWRFG